MMPTIAASQPGQATFGPASAPQNDRERAARRTAEGYEAMFVSQLLGQMFEGVKVEAPFGGGPGETAFRSLLVGEYGKSVAKSGGIGVADQVYREILKMQEAGRA